MKTAIIKPGNRGFGKRLANTEADYAIGAIPNLVHWFSGRNGRRSISSHVDRVERREGRWDPYPLPPIEASATFNGHKVMSFPNDGTTRKLRTTAQDLLYADEYTYIVMFSFPTIINQTMQMCYTHDGADNGGSGQQIRLNPSTGAVNYYLQGTTIPYNTTIGAGALTANTRYFLVMSARFSGANLETRERRTFTDSLTPVDSTATLTEPNRPVDGPRGFGVGTMATATAGAQIPDALAFNRMLDAAEVAVVINGLNANYALAA